MPHTELLIGCGSDKRKKIATNDSEDWSGLVTLDNNLAHNPHVEWDLNKHPLPFQAETFDEIHAYEVLEHLGSQGDYRFFFEEFEEYWRILKPGGIFAATVPTPNSPWALGDPSHTRVFHPLWLIFLNQDEYEQQIGETAMSDFRHIYKANFHILHSGTDEESGTFLFVLEAIK